MACLQESRESRKLLEPVEPHSHPRIDSIMILPLEGQLVCERGICYDMSLDHMVKINMVIDHGCKQARDLDVEAGDLLVCTLDVEVQPSHASVHGVCPVKLPDILSGVAKKVEVCNGYYLDDFQLHQVRVQIQ